MPVMLIELPKEPTLSVPKLLLKRAELGWLTVKSLPPTAALSKKKSGPRFKVTSPVTMVAAFAEVASAPIMARQWTFFIGLWFFWGGLMQFRFNRDARSPNEWITFLAPTFAKHFHPRPLPLIGYVFPDMAILTVLSPSEQVARHLEEGLRRGVWHGTMPGAPMLAGELGIDPKTADTALRLLEARGWLVGQGAGKRRRIELPQEAAAPVLP